MNESGSDKTNDKKPEKILDIRERTFAFAVRIIKLCQYLEENIKISKTIVTQLIKAGTSIGANLEEAQAGQSKPDFISKNSISLKEARESNYWLRLILSTNKFDEKVKAGIDELVTESSEIAKIIGSIIITAKKNN